jgi:predicted aspartyl protease
MKARSPPRASAAAVRGLLRALPALLALCGTPGAALATCQLGRFDLPVTMHGMRAVISARVNGSPVSFIADSGAVYSMMAPADAARLKLSLRLPPDGLHVGGATGADTVPSVATVRQFTLGGARLRNVEFLVAGNELGGGSVGVLGDNVLGMFDTEYDLANGVIRLVRPWDCGHSMLAYWAVGRPYSVIDIERSSPQPTGRAYLNGERIRVVFDTGAQSSIVTLHAAERAGERPGSEGVVPAGFSHGGIGRRALPTWIAPFASFRIGDEAIYNTHLRIGDVKPGDADMLLGADFFLSHHIYVAASQHKVYFTYNGGPVFNLTTEPTAPAPVAHRP